MKRKKDIRYITHHNVQMDIVQICTYQFTRLVGCKSAAQRTVVATVRTTARHLIVIC